MKNISIDHQTLLGLPIEYLNAYNGLKTGMSLITKELEEKNGFSDNAFEKKRARLSEMEEMERGLIWGLCCIMGEFNSRRMQTKLDLRLKELGMD